MNATNLGCQPEHQILFIQDTLQEAAYNYGKCAADLKGAISSGLPGSFTNALSANFLEANSNLELAALQYFDNVYDGETP